MKTAEFMYRCRMCGAIYGDQKTGEKSALDYLISAIGERELRLGIGLLPPLLWIHNCASGSVGVSDLIGYRVEE